MEVLSGLIGAAFVILAIVSIVLYLDTRGDRKALDAWRKATEKRLTGHDEQLALLGRAVSLLVPADARPTTAHKAPSMPFRPSPEEAAAARKAYAEARSRPPVDTEGDRIALQGDPSETAEAIRARFEAEPDARLLARGALPSAETEDEPEDEPTRAHSGRARVRRPTLLGGLAEAPLERPKSDPSRTAEAFRKAHPSSPTLISPGTVLERLAGLSRDELARVDAVAEARGTSREEVIATSFAMGSAPLAANDALTPTAPAEHTIDGRIKRLWHEKIAAAQEAGQDARHCHGARCAAGACECQCDGCALIHRLLIEARQEILG